MRIPFRYVRATTCAGLLLFQGEALAQTPDDQSTQENFSALRREVDQHRKERDALKRSLAGEEANLARLSRALDNRALAGKRGAGTGDTGSRKKMRRA
ncbi:hypothetical protein BLA18110_00812 [Burkholderia lata]|uniref:hypothetical protein n=1 Tax=Burkholderia lata (strain ATCC 17760 / DSM 23089 / LMG 22485 / NCIMB 9086 / R18194 / 383) TaxID=482957 RepID=UPI0014541341|nr:hypothetical protein [Burkholderia lata]VWC59195.1 hypothetical protein BLA18110_00812 [Burkholderia lata]